MYRIMARQIGRRSSTEEIDSFDTKAEADAMLVEYSMAYGRDWALWVEEPEECAL